MLSSLPAYIFPNLVSAMANAMASMHAQVGFFKAFSKSSWCNERFWGVFANTHHSRGKGVAMPTVEDVLVVNAVGPLTKHMKMWSVVFLPTVIWCFLLRQRCPEVKTQERCCFKDVGPCKKTADASRAENLSSNSLARCES